MALVRHIRFLDRIEENNLVWKDGTRMRIATARAPRRPCDADDPDIKDMFLMKYPVASGALHQSHLDPGRVRYAPLFKKIYGDCRTGSRRTPVDVACSEQIRQKRQFTKSMARPQRCNRCQIARCCRSAFLAYLRPTQGTYNCRRIAGPSSERSRFRYSIEIADAHASLWAWSSPRPWPHSLQERDSLRSSMFCRSMASSGVAMVPLRHDAFRIPAGDRPYRGLVRCFARPRGGATCAA